MQNLRTFRRIVPLADATPGAVAFNGAPAVREHRGVLLANPLDPGFAVRILG